MKKAILVTMRRTEIASYREDGDALSRAWADWLSNVGYLPMPIPNFSEPGGYLEFLERVPHAGVLISNGGSVGEKTKGSYQLASNDFDARRDAGEHALIDRCLEKGIPLLGVCRGAQILNVHFGGTLSRGAAGKPGYLPHSSSPHEVNILSPFADLSAGSRWTVNSHHNDLIARRDLAKDLTAFAESPDGVVEGLFHRTAKIVGILWHPERTGCSPGLNESVVRYCFEGSR